MSFAPRNLSKTRPWQQGDGEPASFGNWLRRQREVREISLREIADASKISLRYLEAFEQDRFDMLPAPVFARGFLREYAKYVGLDPDEVVNHFISAQQALEPEDEQEVNASAPHQRPGWLFNLLLVLVVVVVIVLVAVLAFQTERSRGGAGRAPEGAAQAPQGAAQAPEDAVPSPAATAGAGGAAADAPPSAAPATSAAVGGPAEPAPAEPPAPVPAAAAGPAPPLTVTLTAVEDCWVEIDADGSRRTQQRLAAGDSLAVEAQRRVVMTLGNAGGVEVRVNGRRYELGWGRGEVARGVTIDLDTARGLAGGI
jgi:cytoskeleton protein RodZ